MIHIDKSNSVLVAHCFFAHGEVKYCNYDEYYKQEEEHIIDQIEADADY